MIPEGIICEICSDRPAKMVVLRRRSGDIHRTFVCNECANERTRFYAGASLDFEQMLNRVARSSEVSEMYSCKFCGTTLADIVTDGRPGCCGCYSRFSSEIAQAVEFAHGRTYHCGKTPNK